MTDAEAWVHFVCVLLQSEVPINPLTEADNLVLEWKKRFPDRPCRELDTVNASDGTGDSTASMDKTISGSDGPCRTEISPAQLFPVKSFAGLRTCLSCIMTCCPLYQRDTP